MTSAEATVLALPLRTEHPTDPEGPGLDARAADVLFREAHTGYRFSDEPVSDEQLRAIHELVKWAPTAMNSAPLRVTVVRSAEARARLLPHLSPRNRAKAESAPVTAILSYDLDFHEHLPRLQPHDPSLRDRFTDEDARARQASFNAALQAGYFILAVRAVGLAAGPIGGFDRAGVDAEFFPDGRQRAFLVVNLGTAAADGTMPRSPRLEFDDVFTEA